MKTRPILPLLVVLLGLLVPAPAQPRSPRAMSALAPPSCDDKEAKEKLYQKFLDNFKGTAEQQKIAYEAAKEYIAKYGDCTGDWDKKVSTYLRKWLARYASYTPMPRRVN